MINHTVFDHFPILQSKRMKLRKICLEDAEQIYKMRANNRLNQFIARENMDDPRSAEELIHKVEDAYNSKNAIAWAGLLRENKEIIGTCGFNSIDHLNLRAEIGGELNVNYWGKGIAIEAVDAIVTFGLNEMGLHSIEAKVDPNNRAVIYLLEQLKFEKEGHFKDRIFFRNSFRDLAVYTRFEK
jgi:ribosomal-protein-alanine N-acetyltransferase